MLWRREAEPVSASAQPQHRSSWKDPIARATNNETPTRVTKLYPRPRWQSYHKILVPVIRLMDAEMQPSWPRLVLLDPARVMRNCATGRPHSDQHLVYIRMVMHMRNLSNFMRRGLSCPGLMQAKEKEEACGGWPELL